MLEDPGKSWGMLEDPGDAGGPWLFPAWPQAHCKGAGSGVQGPQGLKPQGSDAQAADAQSWCWGSLSPPGQGLWGLVTVPAQEQPLLGLGEAARRGL